VSATTGPLPGLSVWTWVSVTLNGPSTLTSGAAASVDPVTATLPVAPDNVHSGVPALAGAAVGHVPASVAVCSMGGGVNTSETEDELAAGGFVSEPHAASARTSDAAQAMSATEEGTREEITAVTLQPHYAAMTGAPAMPAAGCAGGAEVSRVRQPSCELIDLFAQDIAVTSVPGEFFNHGKQGPSHADCSFAGIVFRVVEVETGGDHA
jgi:hypothetical protein